VAELLGIARFKFHEGKLDEYKRLSARAMEIVRTKDTGTVQYDTYLNEDQSECVIIERYRDSEAALEHAANLADLSAEILATVSVVHGELLGEPSAELRAKLADTSRFSSCPTSRCSHRSGAKPRETSAGTRSQPPVCSPDGVEGLQRKCGHCPS
jgi:quinol monooxygenase YgiN